MPYKILVVDDEKHIVKIVEFNLKKKGYDVFIANNGLEALEQVEKNKPDLILLDVMMPEMDGLEVCKRLKNDDRYKDIPIIMLTAKGQEIDRDTGIKFGANMYITKPFSPKLLLGQIEEILNIQQTE